MAPVKVYDVGGCVGHALKYTAYVLLCKNAAGDPFSSQGV
jgi:hypothetical protein